MGLRTDLNEIVSNITYRFIAAIFIIICIHTNGTRSTPVGKVQLRQQKISAHNNTVYVVRIMQLAKSAEIRNYMKLDENPCDNFFSYVCGNWPKINPADEIVRETNFFEHLSNAYNKKQLQALQEVDSDENSIAEKKVKLFYESCRAMNTLTKEHMHIKLLNIIKEFGEMPVMLTPNAWNESVFDWLQTIGNIQNRYGIDIILQMGIRPDFENLTVNKLFIGQPSLKLQTKTMYTNEGTKWHRNNYKEEIRKNLINYLNINNERAKKTAEDILQFEIRLAKGVIDKKLGNTLKSMTTLRTIDELTQAYKPAIDFRRYINLALGKDYNDTVYEYILDYQTNLAKIILDTPKYQLANYIMYQLIQNFFFDINQTSYAINHICLDKTKIFFAKVLDNTIFRRYNNRKTINDVNLIWENLKMIFRNELQSNKYVWMTTVNRQSAVDKLDAMKLEINSYENADFEKEYQNLNISSTDYIENIKAFLQFDTTRVIAELDEKPKPIEAALQLSYTPAYIASENIIKIPVSLLQPNFLWSDYYPKALKFGTMGYLISHEMLHGFDDMGCNFDLNGRERNWWEMSTLEAFNEEKMCFKKQYAHYRYGGKYLPESELQSENIADNGAIKLAFHAYENWLSEKGAEKSINENELIDHLELLPHLNFTSKQLFFIGFGQFWCNDVSEYYMEKFSLVNIHAPAVFRVIGPLANFVEFSKEFKCVEGTTMNPKDKSIPIIYILAIVPSLMPWDKGYRFLSFCHVFGSVAPWCGSFIYHLFMNIERGENFYYRLLKLDMVGIWVSQSFGALPLVVATTFCFSSLWKWLIIISYCLMSLWGLYKALTAGSPWQRRLCFALPFTMRSMLTCLRTLDLVGGNRVALSHVYLQDGVSILGGAIGAMRIPEKWFPGLVDFYLNSHNIMHVLVVVAVYSMHKATIKDFEWMSTTTCSPGVNATIELITNYLKSNIDL